MPEYGCLVRQAMDTSDMRERALWAGIESMEKRKAAQEAREEGERARAENLSRAATNLQQAATAIFKAEAFIKEDQDLLDAVRDMDGAKLAARGGEPEQEAPATNAATPPLFDRGPTPPVEAQR